MQTARGLIPPSADQAALDDVNDLDDADASQFEDDQINARYLSLVHLYNAGVSTEEIELFSTGLEQARVELDRGRPRPPRSPRSPSTASSSTTVVARRTAELQVADGLGDKLLFRVDEKELAWEAGAGDVDVWEELI